jgi:hypothetical protein
VEAHPIAFGHPNARAWDLAVDRVSAHPLVAEDAPLNDRDLQVEGFDAILDPGLERLVATRFAGAV